MASSFHWVEFDAGLKEFHRILRPGGWFVALWITRLIEANPVLVRIEDELKRIGPDVERVSAGRGGFVETLADRFWRHDGFDETIHLEGRHSSRQDLEQYLGVWRSVNDIQVQLGPERFEQFLTSTAEIVTQTGGRVETTYLPRAWGVRREG
jgi:SAM-dependent methyltransferase